MRIPCSRIQPNNSSSGAIALRRPIWRKLRPGACSSSINRRIGVFSVAGHSPGGWIAQETAAQAPERVNALFLCDA
ncbi:alpha/beta fold hydrolase [Streptomyces sp. NPDC005070]